MPEFINKYSFICVLLTSSSSEPKLRQNYYFSTINISNSQIEILISISGSTYVNGNKRFPNSNFDGNFSTYVIGKTI